MDNDYRLKRINLLDFLQSLPSFKQRMSLHFDQLGFTSGNISLFELVALTSIVNQLEPSIAMEFGTFNGRTTLNLALNTEATLYTVDLPPEKTISTKLPLADGVHDPNNELGFVGLKDKLFNGYKHGSISRIQQIWSDTAQIDVDKFRDKIDFLFIDASHSYENCLNDSRTAHEIVKDGGVIAWHDYNGWPGVTKAINEFSEAYHWMQFHWLHDTSIIVAKNRKMG